MDGIGRTMPVTMAAFFIGSLSIIGLPPLGGSWSKWFLALGALEADRVIFVAVLMISSLLNVAYLMPIVVRAFFVAPAETDGGGHDTDDDHGSAAAGASTLKEAPIFCLIALCVTAAGSVLLFFLGDHIYDLLTPIVNP